MSVNTVNKTSELVNTEILRLEKKQNGAEGVGAWDPEVDAQRLIHLRETARLLRTKTRPSQEQVAYAHRQVSNINPVNMEAALNGVTTAVPLPRGVRQVIVETS